MKKITLFLCLILSLSGCTKTVTVTELPTLPEFPSPESIPFKEPSGKAVSLPDTNAYWVRNNVGWTYEENDTNDAAMSVHIQTIKMFGLIDKTIETKIQNQIDEVVEDLKQQSDFALAPRYNGLFKQYPPESVRIDAISIFTYSDFNYDNLLQVVTYACVDTNQIGFDRYGCGDYSVHRPMTFDLNTGNKINLSDLFVTGSDYVSRLNELVMLEIQSNTEALTEDSGYVTQFNYQGGFKGVRGDVAFSLGYEGLTLIFDEKYPEFLNGFNPTYITVSYRDLNDILAFQQRFASTSSLFIEKNISKANNYRFVDPRIIKVEKRDQTKIESIITLDPSLKGLFKSLTERIIADDQKRIDAAVLSKAAYVRLTLTASAVGPYLSIDRVLYIGGESSEFLRVTYKPDGSPLTFSDVFRSDFDYKSLIISKMMEIAKEREYPDEYDYEAIFKTMNVMLFDFEGKCVRIFNLFSHAPVSVDGTFDIIMYLKDYPNAFLIKDWSD